MPKPKKTPSGKWRVRVYDYCDEHGTRHMKSITADTKAECEYLAAEFNRNKKLVRKTKLSLTVGEAIDKYILLNEVLSPTTLSAYRKVRRTAFPTIMGMQLTDLTDEIVQMAINTEMKRTGEKTGKRISPKTVKNEWGLVSAALKSVGNFSFTVKLPKVQHKNEELPEPEQILMLIHGTEIELPCLLAMWCGLRMGEVRGLMYGDLHDDELWVNRTRTYVDREQILMPYAKTDSSIRKVKISPYIYQMIIDSIPDGKSLIQAKNDLVVPMTQNAIYHRFRRIMGAAGLDITFHDLRHLFASIMLNMLGAPSKVVQLAGGWATPYVMDRVYSQTFSSAQDLAATNMSRLLTEMLTEQGSKPQS